MYEFKKFIFNKRNMGIFGFLIFLLASFIGFNVYMDMNYNDSQIKFYKNAYQDSQTKMDESNSDEEIKFWRQVNQSANRLIYLYMNEKNDTEEFIEAKLTWDNLMLYTDDYEKRDTQTIKNEVNQLNYLNKKHIKLIRSPYEPNAFNLLNMWFGKNLYLIILFILCILLCDVFGLELESGFFKTLYVSKKSKRKILFDKIKISLLIVILLIVSMLIVFIFSGLIFGYGFSEYPYYYFNHMYTVKEIVIKSIFLLSAESVFVVGITSLWFVFSLNNGFILMINLLLYTMFFILGNVIGFSKYFVYVPFLHFDFINLIVHKQALISGLISFIYFLICVLISIQYFKNRELVN